MEIITEPGLAELLDAEAPAGNEQLKAAVDDFLGPGGVAQTALGDSLLDHAERQANLTEEGVGDLWQSLKRWWSGQKQEVIGEEQTRVTLDAYWLTLPDVAGAEVTMTSSRSDAKEVTAALTIAGIGGGPKFSLSVKEDVELPSMTQGRYVLSAMGTFQKIRVTDENGQPVQTYARLASLDKKNHIWTWLADPLPSQATWGPADESTTFELKTQPQAVKRTLAITRGTTWEFGGGLKLEKLGIEAKLGGTLEYVREVTYSYTLPGGHDYVATRYKLFPAYVWSVT